MSEVKVKSIRFVTETTKNANLKLKLKFIINYKEQRAASTLSVVSCL